MANSPGSLSQNTGAAVAPGAWCPGQLQTGLWSGSSWPSNLGSPIGCRRRRQCDQCRTCSMGAGRRSVRRVIRRLSSGRLRGTSPEDPFLLSRHPTLGPAGRSGRRGRPWPASCGGASRRNGAPGTRPGRNRPSRSGSTPQSAKHTAPMNGYQVGDVSVIGARGCCGWSRWSSGCGLGRVTRRASRRGRRRGRLPQSLARQGLGEEVWAGLPEVNRLLAVRWVAVLAGRALPETVVAPSVSGETGRS
jgi:hypothetical protein